MGYNITILYNSNHVRPLSAADNQSKEVTSNPLVFKLTRENFMYFLTGGWEGLLSTGTTKNVI